MQGMTTGPSQIQPVTQRERDQLNTDWTSMHQRTSQGGGQSRGRAGQGENRPRGVNPNTKQQSRTKQPRETTADNKHTAKGNRDNTTKNQTTKRRTTHRQPKEDNQSEPNRASRTMRTPAQHPEKQNRQEEPQKHEAKRSNVRQETNRNTKNENKLSTGVPAQSADRHASTKEVKIKT